MTGTPDLSEPSCFIIAEAGVNHNGDIDTAREMIEVAVDAGVDAVKFQTFSVDRLVTRDAETAAYQKRSGEENQYEMLKRYELTPNEFEDVADYCRDQGVEFISTPYDRDSLGVLVDLGVDRVKIASADIINKPLLEAAARSGSQVILSTGMASVEEIAQAVDWVTRAGGGDVTVLHCVSEYPTDPEDLNLRFIETLDEVFDTTIGFSDHTLGLVAPVAAVALGARVIEKHFTLDSDMQGPDHEASLEPDELRQLVDAIRVGERSLGTRRKQITDEERANAQQMRPSLHAATDLSVGDRLEGDSIRLVRPADGLAPRFLEVVSGAVVRRNLSAGQPITWQDIT